MRHTLMLDLDEAHARQRHALRGHFSSGSGRPGAFGRPPDTRPPRAITGRAGARVQIARCKR